MAAALAGLKDPAASSRVSIEVLQERARQDALWGEQNHGPEKWLVILLEEAGETAQAFLDGDESDYRREMIQVAAVACAAVEAFDRRKADGT